MVLLELLFVAAMSIVLVFCVLEITDTVLVKAMTIIDNHYGYKVSVVTAMLTTCIIVYMVATLIKSICKV